MALPEKENLTPEERKRRKNLDDPTVAQEASDLLEEYEAKGWSPSLLWTLHHYSPSQVVKKVKTERKRVIAELEKGTAVKDITSVLSVAKVDTEVKAKKVAEEAKAIEDAKVVGLEK